MARMQGGACYVRPSAGPQTMPLPRLAMCNCLTWVTHFLWKTWQGHCGPFPLPATSLHFGPHSRDATAEGWAFGCGPAGRGCLWDDTVGAGPASWLGMPGTHSPRVKIPAASGGPATGVSRRGCRWAAQATFHTTPIPNRCARHCTSDAGASFLLAGGLMGGMRKSWIFSPEEREQCKTCKNFCCVCPFCPVCKTSEVSAEGNHPCFLFSQQQRRRPPHGRG